MTWALTEQEFAQLIKDLRTIVILNASVVTENCYGPNPVDRLGGSLTKENGMSAQIAWDWLEHFGVGYK